MADKKFYLTQEGLKKLELEHKQLKSLRARMVGKDETPEVMHSDELNAEFVSFREDLDLLDSRLEDLDHILNNYEIIKPPSVAERNKINLGACVMVDVNGQEDEFFIVGTLEADPMSGKISNESPVGKALMGHKAGDEVLTSSPAKIIFKVKTIHY